MATNLRKVGDSFTSENTVNILFSENGLRSPRMITADLSYFTKSKDGNIIIPPGYIWQRLGNGFGRVLPMIKAAAVTPTTSNQLTVVNADIFKVGEILVKGATVIGTIQSIDPATNKITLAANAAAAVAINDVLNVQGMVYTDILGMNISVLNLSERSNDVACYTSASVYADRLPQWNASIKAEFPEITLV
jgi:tartrate dehydratase beta subunit/fumarate hydratase class I family protein